MKKTKTQKGITLIALIITIVVLLILAVVAIGAAQESNIVGYAQNAATKYEEAKDNELSLLSKYETELDKYATNKESATGGVKAYNFNGKIIIITPENELYQYNSSSDLFPSYKLNLSEVKIENDPTFNITISTTDFTQEEISKIKLITTTGMDGICAYFEEETGRDTMYFNPITSGSTQVTITKSMPIQHSDTLLAQYYHESPTSCGYFGYGQGNTGLIFVVNYVEGDKYFEAFMANNGTVLELMNKKTVEIEQNETEFNIKLHGSDYTIRTDAKKIILPGAYEGATINYYIQDDILIYGWINGGVKENYEYNDSNDSAVPLIKVFNSSIIETQQ